MSTTFDFDRLLESVLQGAGPHGVPETLVNAALSRSRDVAQRRPPVPVLDRWSWPASRFAPLVRPSSLDPRVVRVLLVAVIAIAMVAVAAVGSALRREDPPIRGLQSTFIRPFEYTIPADSRWQVSGDPSRQMVAWTSGPDDWPHPSDPSNRGSVYPQLGEVRGVVIGLGEPAMSHSSAGRFTLAPEPVSFLTELRDLTGVRMDTIVETTFDGRAAAKAQLPGVGGSDIHPGAGGLAMSYVVMTLPSRLTVTEVDGTTIFIFVWARNARELDAWLPDADRFVASIHFVQE